MSAELSSCPGAHAETAEDPSPVAQRTSTSHGAWAALHQLKAILPLLFIGGYVLGYLSIRLFCSRLGVTAQDLGIATQDYVLVSGVLAAPVLLTLAVSAAADAGGNHPHESDAMFVVRITAGFSCGFSIALLYFPVPTWWVRVVGPPAVVAISFLLGMAYVSVRPDAPQGPVIEDTAAARDPVARPVLVSAVAAAFVVALSLLGASAWGTKYSVTSPGPVNLAAVIDNQPGVIVDADGTRTCVYRLSPKVFVVLTASGDDQAAEDSTTRVWRVDRHVEVLGAAPTVFQPGSCDPITELTRP